MIPKMQILTVLVILLPLVFTAISNGDVPLHKNANLSQLITEHMKMLNLKLDPTANSSAEKEEFNYQKMLRIKDVLDVFSITNLAENWSSLRSEFSSNCSEDMTHYFNGMSIGRMWAAKMDDASGHYTSGFFYGNNYWMGSLSLCQSIYKDDFNSNDESNLKASGAASPARNSGLPFAKAHQHVYQSVGNENPPFVPGFFVMKMLVNETYMTPMIRVIYVGVCLPSSCSRDDIKQMSRVSLKAMEKREVTILDVRVPTDRQYNIFKDKTFWILTIVSLVVFTLMFFGTIYDVYLTRKLKKALREQDHEMNNSETSSGIGCASSDYSDSIGTNDLKKELKDLKIHLELPRTTDEHLEGHPIEPEKLSIYSELLLSFSAITNFNAICDRNVGSDTIPSIHGLRAISMAWVILGHTCIVIFKYSDNMEMRKDVEENFFFQAITNGPFSVDTFFFISGFLVSYLYFRTNAKGKLKKLSKGASELTSGACHFVGLVAYRFMRLTAPYMFVLGVVQVSMKYLAAYSIFDPPTNDHITCPDYWWRNVLYINTLFPVEQMCMLWSWYLANDTQFYMIGAIILIVGVRHFKLAAGTMAIFLVSSWITTAVIAFSNNHRPNTDDPLALFDKIYDKPWTRIGPYLIGMAVGWILFRTNCKIRLPKTTVAFAWTAAMLNLFVLVFGLYKTELSQFTAAAYSSLSHSAWAISLAWITIACSTGYGGPINTLLSAPCIYPFSRVTYCAYLVHPIVIRALALNSDAPLHLGSDSMVVTFCGLVVCSYVLSFIVSLAFEAPVVTMLKILTPNRKKRLSQNI